MIRLYGVTTGHGSLSRVTDGVRGALSDLGLLAGFVPVDNYDEDVTYPGGEAAIGVLTAPLGYAWLMKAIGKHGERLALLPPNSTWVPEKLLESLRSSATGLLAPSKWAEGILLSHGQAHGLRVSVWKHGVDRGFTTDPRDLERRKDDYARGGFTVFHMSSTDRDRKGSRELVEGWVTAQKRGSMGGQARLVLCVDDPARSLQELLENRAQGDARIISSVGFTASRMEYSVSDAAREYRRYHLVAQPSRGEGFGLCPLEARACGVPILVTDCTGHSAFVRKQDPGTVIVPTGQLDTINDGPGAMAPSLSSSDVASALGQAYACWADLQEGADVFAPAVQQQWSWAEVTRQWLDGYKIVSSWPKSGG